MPIYEFATDAHEIVEELLSMNDAPEIGARYQLPDGRMATRLPPSNLQGRGYDFTHVGLGFHPDPNWNNDKCLKGPDGKRLYPHVNEQGSPVFTSKREIQQFMGKTRFHYELGMTGK